MRLRIDELAAEAGTTSRNVRAYQARGLLPPPELEGRTGYYGEEHLRRLQLIDDLQQRGFSLAAIREVLDIVDRGGDLASLVGLRTLVSAPFTDETPTTLPLDDVLARFPEAADDPALLQDAVELGLVRPIDGGRVEVPSPTLLDAGAELTAAGVPLRATLELVSAVRADVDDIARRFVSLAVDHVLRPAADGDGDVAAAIEALQRLRPVAMEVVRPFLAQAMQRATESAAHELGEQDVPRAG